VHSGNNIDLELGSIDRESRYVTVLSCFLESRPMRGDEWRFGKL